jgi:hypothetical protein
MKVAVVLPSDEYRSSAGARIRYDRILDPLAHEGVELTPESISRFDPGTTECDAVIFSKCHDARSLVAASISSQRGKLVGVDLFDDYFSDRTDSRLVRYRSWLGQLVEFCDFALCSTESMRSVAHQYRSDLPTHVLNDPAPEQDFGGLAALLEKKKRDALNDRCLRVVWFGVGDNPTFPVGLSDLAAYEEILAGLTRGRMAVELTVLTNRRALNATSLSRISRLPVRVEVEEWSEAAERRVLRKALVAFLPINARPFSTAKSLNRAITALSAGCQVISAGFPLYATLGRLIYRDPGDFMADLEQGALRASAKTMAEYRRVIKTLANAEREGRRLAAFLRRLPQRANSDPLLLSLVHGQTTITGSHKLVRSAGGLSVASPFCSAVLDFDVVFRGPMPNLTMVVSKRASSLLLPHARLRLKGRQRIHGEHFRRLPHAGAATSPVTPEQQDWQEAPLSFQLAVYSETMRVIEQRLIEAFGPGRMIVSESSQLPFQMAA